MVRAASCTVRLYQRLIAQTPDSINMLLREFGDSVTAVSDR